MFSFITFSTCKSNVYISNSLSTNASNGCILLAITYVFKGQIPMAEKPLHMLVVVNAFVNARDTHCAKSYLLAPLFLLTNVQTSLYALKVVLKGLKHETSNGCNACEVCDGKVIKSNPTPIVLCTTSKVTCKLWPLGWISGDWLGLGYL